MSGPTSRGGNKSQRAELASALEQDPPAAANPDPSPQSSASSGSDIRAEIAAETGEKVGSETEQSPANSLAPAQVVDEQLRAPAAKFSHSLPAAMDLAATAENTFQITTQLARLAADDPHTLLPLLPALDNSPATDNNSTADFTLIADTDNTGGSSDRSGDGGNDTTTSAAVPNDGPGDNSGTSTNTQGAPIAVAPIDPQFSDLIEAIKGVSMAVTSDGKAQTAQLFELQAEIRALASILTEASTKSQINPELVEQLSEATEELTGAVGELKQTGGKVDARLARITEELGKLTEGLANFRFHDIIDGIHEISDSLERGAGINEDLLTEILEKIDASNGTTKLDETQLTALTEAIERLEQGQAAQRNPAENLADKSNKLLALMLDELKALREQMEKSKPEPQPKPDQKDAPDGRTFTTKEARAELVGMLEQAEREGRHTLDVVKFLEKLEALKFITIMESVANDGESTVSNRNFKIHYKNPRPLERRAAESDADFEKREKEHYVTISNSAEELYSMKAWTWAPTLLTVGLLVGAAATVAVGAASIVTTAAVIAAPLYLSKMWMSKQVDQVRTRYDGVFKLPITQQAGSALSPEKMLLETLATYLHVQQLPEHIRWLNWAPKGITKWRPDDVSTNDAYYATGPLLKAMMNTIKFWDNFKYNIPNLDDRKVVDPAKISELRTNEFDQVLEDFKKDWIGPIRQSFLKIPFACERVCGMGATVGVIAGVGSAVTGGGLSWLLKAIF